MGRPPPKAASRCWSIYLCRFSSGRRCDSARSESTRRSWPSRSSRSPASSRDAGLLPRRAPAGQRAPAPAVPDHALPPVDVPGRADRGTAGQDATSFARARHGFARWPWQSMRRSPSNGWRRSCRRDSSTSLPRRSISSSVRRCDGWSGRSGIDRSTLAEFSPDLGFLRFTHSWAADGADRWPGLSRADLVPWACARLEATLPVVVDRMSDLPREASVDEVFWQRTGVRSLVIWPLHVGDELAGSLSLVCLRDERAWSETDLRPCAELG